MGRTHVRLTKQRTAYYVPVKIGTEDEVMLLDSGCTQSILPTSVIRQIANHCCTPLIPTTGHCTLADGKSVKLEGTTHLTFKLGSTICTHQFLVANLDHQILLGLNFFEQFHCHIDFSNCLFRMGEQTISCCDEQRQPFHANVQAKYVTILPPRAESLVEARIVRPWNRQHAFLESKTYTDGVVIASALYHPQQQPKIYVRMLNHTTEPVTIPPGKVLTRCCTVESIESPQSEGATPDAFEQEVKKWCQHLPALEKQAATQMLRRHQEVFSAHKYDLGRTDLVKHEIPLVSGTRPLKQRPYRHGPVQEKEIERQVQELRAQGLIREGYGAWSSPVVLVQKKDGSWRFCVDYRKLNDSTHKDAYPLPRIDDSLDALGGSKYFSTLDLTSGYWQVELEESAKEKAAFSTRSGLWEGQVLSFGLTSAPSTFERLMETVLRGLHWQTVLIYLDDIIVFSKDMNSHLERLAEVFQRLTAAGLKLKPQKCTLFAEQVQYLGHVVSQNGISTDDSKVQRVQEWPRPQHKTDVRAFLGTCGYYRRFIPRYSEVSRSLSQLCSKDSRFQWDEECELAFNKLKAHLVTAPILAYPDYAREFILDTDASQVGTGAVLSQIHGGQERVVSYYSKMYSSEESNYCVTRQELLAIIKAVRHFRPQLYGRRFLVRTDHASLVWLLQNPAPTGQLARWLETLSEYNFRIQHRKGRKHNNADGLSRQICKECKQWDRMFPSSENKINLSQTALLNKGQRFHSTATQTDIVLGITTVQAAQFPIFHSKKTEPQEWSEWLKPPMTHRHMSLVPNDMNDQRAEVAAEVTHAAVKAVPQINVEIDAIRQAQETDAVIGPVYRAFQKGVKPNVDQVGGETKALLRWWEELSLLGGRLMIKMRHRREGHKVTVLPRALRSEVVESIHKQAHLGINKTLLGVQEKWYWPGMSAEIRRQVQGCQQCQQAKPVPHRSSNPQNHLHAGRPWQILAIDLCGPFPETNQGNTQILVLADHFTRWYDAIPIKDGTATTVARVLDERVFSYFGVPECIHSDQGKQFTSQIFQECCLLWGCDKTRSSPYHPQGNSVVERLNRTLGNSLRALLAESLHREWDLLVPQILRTIRATPHRITGETPNFLMLGREVKLPADLLFQQEDPQELPVEEFVDELRRRLQKVHERLRQQQMEMPQPEEEGSPYKEGDKVWLKSYYQGQGRGAKLRPKYVGPYTITKVLPFQTYRMVKDGKYSVQHEGRIKAYVESTESRQKDRALAATPPVSSDTSPPTVTETPPPTKPSQDSVTNGFFTEEEDDVEMLSVTPPLPEDPAIARPTGALPDAEPDVDVDNRADVEPETDRLPPTSSMKELAKEESVDVNQEDDDHPQEGESAAIEELETCGEEIYSADHGFRSSRQRRKPVRFGDYHLDRVHSWSKSNYANRVVPKKSETQTILHADWFSNYHEEFPALVEAANPIKGLKKGPIPGRNSISGGDGVVNNILRAIEQYTLLQVDGPE